MGLIPLPNRLPLATDPPDALYPLRLVLCQRCYLVQLGDVVEPTEMFVDYSYVPSTSWSLTQHFRELAETIMTREKPQGLVVDIGGNDGLLLSFFLKYGMKTLCIDPAVNLAEKARARGVETDTTFFTFSVGKKYEKQARVITATNCLAHTAKLVSYLDGVKAMLAPDGVFIAEFPYLLRLLDGCQLDTIYHEHQSYFSLIPLFNQLPEFGLYPYDASIEPVHGGSIRLWIKPEPTEPTEELMKLLAREQSRRLFDPWTYKAFTSSAVLLRDRLKAQLDKLGPMPGLAASAKAAILLNYAKIGSDRVPWIVDANPLKQGRAIPGVRIPILPEEHLREAEPDWVLILAWNLMSDMEQKLQRFSPKTSMLVPGIYPKLIPAQMLV